jgi:hypothetical protein
MARASTPRSNATFFGIPVGDFGGFASVLLSFAAGCITFFVLTFISIFGIMILNGFGHHISYAMSYRWIALPVAVIVLVISLVYLGALWLSRKFRGEPLV